MNKQIAIDSIEERLRAFATSRAAAPAVRDQAQRFLSRLISPVRVTILGRPSPGKSTLLSALAGEPILPPVSDPPTAELRFGPRPAAQITRPDGLVTEPSDPMSAAHYEGAILAVLERPLPILKRLSFLDVQADDAPGDQRAAINWAAPRTDIALWCSARFDATDRAIWAQVPDQIKDHGYLVLTDCDPVEAAGVKAAALDEFHDVYVVDFKSAEEASRVEDLSLRLEDHARLGRQADADAALLFLRAQEAAMPRPVEAAPGARPVSRPRTAAAAAMPAAADPAPAADTTPPPTRPVTRNTERRRAAVGEGFEIYSAGLSFIRTRAAELLATLRAGNEVLDAVIAQKCGETLVHLSDMLMAHDDGTEPGIAELADVVMDAEGLVVLMENERGAQPALDALAILMQVRRDFETRLAA